MLIEGGGKFRCLFLGLTVKVTRKWCKSTVMIHYNQLPDKRKEDS